MAGLPWIPLDVEFPESRKAIALGIALEQPMAWAYVVKLWTKAAKHAADGRVEGPAAVATIEQWASWNGSPGALVEAMALPHVALLDHTDSGFYIHDWHEHCGAHAEKREKDRKRMRRVRSAKRSQTVREPNANVRGEREIEKERERETDPNHKRAARAVGVGHPAFEAIKHWTEVVWPKTSSVPCPAVETHQAQSLAALCGKNTTPVVLAAMDRAAADSFWADKLDLDTFIAKFPRFLHDKDPAPARAFVNGVEERQEAARRWAAEVAAAEAKAGGTT